MKHNTHDASMLVSQAIRALSYDYNLTTARSYLVAALNEINKVAKKRERRENTRIEIEKTSKLNEEKQKKLREELAKKAAAKRVEDQSASPES